MLSYFNGIEIEINHHCNLSCPYCPNSVTKRSEQGVMSSKVFEKIMIQLREIHFKGRICYHFYNEPLLHPDLDGLVCLSKKILPDTKSEIYTNGVFLTKERYLGLTSAGVDKFTVTKHKGTKKIPFEEVWSGLSKSERARHRFVDHNGLLYTNRGGLVEFGKDLTPELRSRPCYIPRSSIVVTVDGHVLACYEDYQQKNVMGNIHEQTLDEIWKSKKFVEFREDLKRGERHKHPVCSVCNNRLMF